MTVSVTFGAFGEETLHPIFLRRGFHARILWPVCCDINHVPVVHTGEVNSGHPGPRPSGVPPSSARGFFAPARGMASPLHVCCVWAHWLTVVDHSRDIDYVQVRRVRARHGLAPTRGLCVGALG